MNYRVEKIVGCFALHTGRRWEGKKGKVRWGLGQLLLRDEQEKVGRVGYIHTFFIPRTGIKPWM